MRARVLLAAAVALGVLSACGVTSQPAAGPVAAAQGAPVRGAVPASLSFAGKTLDGAPFEASSLAGKPVILWFWAPWCATCASEAQSISDLNAEFGARSPSPSP
jgi:thiol-disulfide isomerase/thioredoxin